RGRRPDQLCGELPRCLSPGGSLCRPHPQGRQAIRIAGPATDQIRDGDQSQDRQGPRPHRAADAARCRRRGDRMSAKMERREFITLLGGAAAWPLAVRAQQARTVARVGVLGPNLSNPYPSTLYQAILAKLRESGFSEGQNLAADYQAVDDPRGP